MASAPTIFSPISLASLGTLTLPFDFIVVMLAQSNDCNFASTNGAPVAFGGTVWMLAPNTTILPAAYGSSGYAGSSGTDNICQPTATTSAGSMGAFANAIVARTGRNLVVCCCAMSGSSIIASTLAGGATAYLRWDVAYPSGAHTDWTDRDRGSLLGSAVQRTKLLLAAGGNFLCGTGQLGETDMTNGTQSERLKFATNWQASWDAYRAATGVANRFIIQKPWTSVTGATGQGIIDIRAQQDTLAVANSQLVVEASGVTLEADGIHWDITSVNASGVARELAGRAAGWWP